MRLRKRNYFEFKNKCINLISNKINKINLEVLNKVKVKYKIKRESYLLSK